LEKFRNKYRINSARAPFWDYGWNAAYFITICTKDRICYFGDVLNGKLILSEIGQIANRCWLEIPDHFPFVHLDSYVIMPNHVHGIVIIDKPDGSECDDGTNVENHGSEGFDGTNVETQDFASLRASNQPQFPESSQSQTPKNKFGPQSNNLASIVRGFKIGVTKNARLINPKFAWQPRYHDHIIRNEKSYQKISCYISDNPKNWKYDTFFNLI
jgi:putative transposase